MPDDRLATQLDLIKRIRQERERRAQAGSYRESLEDSLAHFVQAAWPTFEGVGLVWNWHLDVLCSELERITWQLPRIDNPLQIQRRLISNMPPRSGKSSVISACWPVWTWIQKKRRGPLSGPHVQFLYVAYAQMISEKDARNSLAILKSDWFRENWPEIGLRNEAAAKFTNTHGGHRIATSIGGPVTGDGGSVVVIDDLIGAEQADSQGALRKANDFMQDRLTNRLNDPINGAMVLNMQRMHAADPTAGIMQRSDYHEWRHVMLPMEYDPTRRDVTDPREEPGELLDPERWNQEAVDRLRVRAYAYATQYQQEGRTRDGEIIKQEWWHLWPAEGFEPKPGEQLQFPTTSFRVLVVDTAMKEKEENDPSAAQVWGIWHGKDEVPRAIMLEAWKGKVPLSTPAPVHGSQHRIDPRDPKIGLTERVLEMARRRQVDAILIEDKTRGHDVALRLRELTRKGEWQVIMLPAVQSKIARMNSVVPIFADGLVYAPDFRWADDVINEVIDFPNGQHDDQADCVAHALTWLWDRGFLLQTEEAIHEAYRSKLFRPEGDARTIYD